MTRWFENDGLELVEEHAGWSVIEPTSIRSVIDVLAHTESSKGWIFRGQADHTWQLQPSLFRHLENPNPGGIAKRHLDKFKIYARGRVMNPDAWGDNRYWALGRHYGLRTPLLDWTASPFIASFFAFKEESNSEYRAVYGLDASLLNKELCFRVGSLLLDDTSLKHTFETRFDLSATPEPEKAVMLGYLLLDRYDTDLKPTNELHERYQHFISTAHEAFARILSPKMGDNPRLLSQRGLFTFQESPKPLEELIETSPLKDQMVLIKLRIPSEWKEPILEKLNGMNINHLSMFPDLEGAARYCNDRLVREAEENVRELNINRIWI